ncbi:MAG: transglutaminase domain-containing protein [Bacteroidota bacterium]
MRIRFLSFVLVSLYINLGYATDAPEIKFGKISKSELTMQFSSIDSSASATVLADFGRTRISYTSHGGFQLVFTRHRRIKILTSNGYNWADVAVPLYKKGSNREMISHVKGYTYNLEGGKTVKTKLKSEGKFLEQYDENHQIYKFTLPNVKEGSVIEYTYQITSDFIFNLQDWTFQHSIPTVWSEYEVEIPEYFFYKPLSQGYYPLVINEQTKSGGTYNIDYRSQTPNDISQDRSQARREQINYAATKYHWAAQNVPSLVEEPYVTTMSDYVLKVEMELAGTRFPGEVYKNFTTTWEEIDEELLESTYFGDVIKRKGAVKDRVDALVVGKTSSLEKIAAIYQYVQQHIRWNQSARMSTSQTLRKTLDEKSGSSADINLLLITMLREAGISTEPVVLSTRSHGLLRKAFPRLNQFNYVVALASTDDGQILLDATDNACPMGVLPTRCLNQEGRIISEEPGEKWVSLMPSQKAEGATMATLTLENGELSGLVSRSHTGYDALRIRRKVSRENGVDGYLTKLKENNHSWNIQDYQMESLEMIGKPVKEKYQVSFQESVQEAGNLLYLTPILVNQMDENPFKSEQRAFPVDYPCPEREFYMLNLTIPDGYQVDEMPEDMIIALPEQAGQYTFTTKQVGNTIQIVTRYNIERMRFYAQEYPQLRQFYNLIVAKQQEQIVLKKIN